MSTFEAIRSEVTGWVRPQGSHGCGPVAVVPVFTLFAPAALGTRRSDPHIVSLYLDRGSGPRTTTTSIRARSSPRLRPTSCSS